jgi:beta-aspartyl-peptidase (threonine type)
MQKIALAIHGGAGTIDRARMTPELEREYRGGLGAALTKGWDILKKGGSSVDAVEAAVCSLEDFPLFNAGRGSVFTHEGRQEMDACIMDGYRLQAGGVAALCNIKNPISVARIVMYECEHILLSGRGALEFAEQNGFHQMPDEYFFTEHRWLQYQEAFAAGRVELDHNESTFAAKAKTRPVGSARDAATKALGTVGAVACDKDGFLAAATSTGGMTNKRNGRLGDSASVGQGTYADDVVAVSCTGHGEYFMLGVTAYDVAARMKYKGLSLENAASESVERLTNIKGEGGLIAVDARGNVAMPFNSEGMYRGSIRDSSEMTIEIYR